MKKRESRMCSRKKRFKDIEQVKRAVSNILRNTGDKLRYYKCPICKGYHISSKGEGEFYVRKRKEVRKR